MTKKEIAEHLNQYVVNETMSDSNHINNDTLLFEQGIFDSIGLLLLIEFIKNEFEVTTNDDELLIENFESINSMVGFIAKKLANK